MDEKEREIYIKKLIEKIQEDYTTELDKFVDEEVTVVEIDKTRTEDGIVKVKIHADDENLRVLFTGSIKEEELKEIMNKIKKLSYGFLKKHKKIFENIFKKYKVNIEVKYVPIIVTSYFREYLSDQSKLLEISEKLLQPLEKGKILYKMPAGVIYNYTDEDGRNHIVLHIYILKKDIVRLHRILADFMVKKNRNNSN